MSLVLCHILNLVRESTKDTILVTGGAGFIGSNFVLDWLQATGSSVINFDLLTYAGNPANLASVETSPRYAFVRGDICDGGRVGSLLGEHRPRAIVHFAAESHVDRSIASPEAFIRTNVHGTFVLLEQVRAYWSTANEANRAAFRFLHVSTDEVYGTLGPMIRHSLRPRLCAQQSLRSIEGRVRPSGSGLSPHFGLPVLTTNCSNNYGPFQFPEKLIPLMILNALEGKALPVYGDGKNVRDWLFVEDHCSAIRAVLERGDGRNLQHRRQQRTCQH